MERVETYYMKVIDNQGNTIEEHSYNPWGNHRNSNNWTLSNFSSSLGINRGFTGHEMLPQFQLINMNGRMYDPVIGRMLSPDNVVVPPQNKLSDTPTRKLNDGATTNVRWNAQSSVIINGGRVVTVGWGFNINSQNSGTYFSPTILKSVTPFHQNAINKLRW